ncbi:MAG TPA: hypothetical protein IAC25_02455 [Candidatus Enterenecus stercoripullorum]|nr:hypothetical protein [Candidatus Enterenecus stercoripullorum]
MSKFLDQILRPEVQSVQDALPTAEYEIKRLSRLCGERVSVTLKALPYGKTQDLKNISADVEIHILLAGCQELRDPALQAKFGGATPVETVKAMLLPGEIEDLSRAVERLTGYRQNTIREIKNGSGRAATRT